MALQLTGSLKELDYNLPNGFHDALIERIAVD